MLLSSKLCAREKKNAMFGSSNNNNNNNNNIIIISIGIGLDWMH